MKIPVHTGQPGQPLHAWVCQPASAHRKVGTFRYPEKPASRTLALHCTHTHHRQPLGQHLRGSAAVPHDGQQLPPRQPGECWYRQGTADEQAPVGRDSKHTDALQAVAGAGLPRFVTCRHADMQTCHNATRRTRSQPYLASSYRVYDRRVPPVMGTNTPHAHSSAAGSRRHTCTHGRGRVGGTGCYLFCKVVIGGYGVG